MTVHAESTETHEFKMHPKMLLDIIERQAGTLEKAVLEATMNAAEAGATRFEIDFTIGETSGFKRIVMTDNGKGIKTRDELEQHFRTFGTPHEASENKKWAQFRMGRGQCFAQGRNVWKTCGWQMETDIRADVKANRLPRFNLTKAAQEFRGCRIEIDLYADKFGGTVEYLKSMVKEQIEFVDMDVVFNGEKINRPPAQLKWTDEDEDAYYLFGVGQDLIIYNMGVRCQKIPASTAGAVGVIVSKSQLKVNFARNEVLTDCPIMQRIQQVIKANRVEKTRKQARRLNKEERIAALLDLRDGIQEYDDLKSAGLFFTTSGRSLSFRDILNCRIPWTFGSQGDIVCDKLMQAGQALCVDKSCVFELNYSGDSKSFFRWLTRSVSFPPNWTIVEGLYRSSADLKQNYNENSTLLPREQWTKKEKRLIRVLESFGCWDGRGLTIGVGAAYNGWTDGKSYIAIERDFIKRSHLSHVSGAVAFFGMLVHELAHTDASNGSHCHGEEFYRAFHNIIRYGKIDSESDKYGMPGGPFCYVETFVNRMKRAVAEEETAAAIARETKAKERIDKALGLPTITTSIAADTTVDNAPAPRLPRAPRVKARHKSFGKRRIPAGAE